MKGERGRGSPRRQLVAGLAVVVLAAAAFAAYGASAGTSTTRAAAKCGDIPKVAPKDPQKLVAKLPASLRAEYQGFSGQILPSAWTNWKPKGSPPYTVGVLFEALVNPFQSYAFNLVQKFLKRSKLVGQVIAVTAAKSGDVPGQLQLYESLVQQGVDIIVLQAASASGLAPAVEAAGKKGIPTVGIINPIDTRYSVDVVPNAYVSATRTTAEVMKILGGKGNVLLVHGVPGVQVDVDTFVGFSKMLALCPDVKVVGEINGFFAPPAAKGAVLQWLASHADKVDAVLHTAVMAPAIIQAFLQAGRPVPSVIDIAAQKGSVAYWAQNASKGYKTAGDAGGGTSFANLVTRVTLRMLAGQGPKLSDIMWPHPLLTNANVSNYAQPGWTLDTPGTVENPKPTWLTDKNLDLLFSRPERKDGVRF